MGKEQDLLQAAKNGNVAQIEKILGLKTRKSGIQSLISRTVNPNHQDELGNTSLHHAALNGHRSSVELLLKYDASTNIPDNSGNYPLHLAAWNGHADVAKVLINTGPSRANVNEQNGTEEAALHSASQFGHSTVVAVLLENHADPYVRNSKQESPLDLAAQYGRMETVKQLLSYHPNLLEDVNVIKTHTPLHLAARNGHMNVVSYFLSCGMDVNIQCNRGTALHEAALFGKVDVVNLLLQCGIDATVVDSSNKTVMDLLSSHPSARSREIKDLIYERMRGSRIPPANKLQGNITRACSAIYSRNMTYSDVPEPRPYLKGVDPSNLRRSGSYDFVPSHRARQESLNQSNYDIVPPPRDRNAATEYAEESPWPSNNIQIPPAGKDYALLGPAESPFSSAAPVLSPHEITEGYTLLGSPAQGAASPLCPLRPDSAYAEVRSEGQNFLQPKQTPPSQGVFDDYSRLRFPSEDGEATAPAGMAGRDNPGYFMVSHPSHQHSQSVKQNSESYDFVAPIPRPSSYQPESTYEVPPLSLRGRGNGQEEDHPAIQGLTPQTFGGRSPEVYENTFIPPQKQKQEQRQQRSSEYDLVSLPSRKASQDTATYGNVPVPPQDSATYGNVPVPGQDLGTYDNVSVQRQVSATYDNVPAPGQFQNQMLEDVASTHDSSASAGYSSSRGSQACPLDVPDYEFVQLRKPSDGSAPEMQPFAALPGYEPMGPPDNQRGGDEYEFLAPFVEPQERPDARGDYETLAMVAPQRTGSQTGATAVPGSMNLPVSSPLYEVPPTLSSPVYEIAPPPRQTPPISSPVYEIAPPPRQTAPPPPPQEMPMQLHGDHEGHWIEVEHSKDQPKVPPRRQNQYSECPLVKRPEPETPASSKPPKPGSYEQVRLEGPNSGAIDWDKVRQLSRQESGGEYCTISAAAAGPGEAANRDSSSSSERSSITDTPMTPPFSPPSPSTAVAMVFDTLGTFPQSDMSTIPEVPEDSSAGQESPAPVPKPRARKKGPTATKPKVLPRSDSLNDEEFQLSAEDVQRVERSVAAAVSEEQQDPFSFPPTVSSSEVELKKKTVKKSDFGDLHKRFSPYSSREDLTADSPEAESQPNKKREEPDGAEVEPAVKPSPLVYENVLFKRSENSQGSENGHVVKSEEHKERPESYRLSALSADSPMDESEEWKKIEAFLSTFSQIDVPQTLDDRIADAGRAETVPDWLKALDLGQFESSMMANGFDDIRFLNGVIEDEDLLDIGIEKFSHRRTIMEAVKSLPRCPRLSDPAITKPESVEDWLELIALPEYLGVFQHNGFTSLERVLMLWEVELTSVLEINSLGHRKRMLASVTEELKESDNKQQIEEPTDLEDSSAQLEDKLAELKMYCPDEKPPTTTTATPTSAEDLMAAAESMIASSTEAAEAKPRKKQKPPKRWKHDPSVLVKGSVNYSILYLGSHAVKTITGLESTIEACRKMRLSTAKLQKIPSVVLSVSVKGIKFIDGRSKIIVSHHEMSNISYITQDPNDRRVLAYIAKDSKTDRHYCHVFRADSNTASDEVTMTIGQAFELAFSHFVQTHNPSSDQ